MDRYSNLKTGKRKVPRKATSKSLEKAALHYLARFSSSRANFRKIMMRRVYRSAEYHNTNLEVGAAIVEELADRFTQIGLLDDKQFAAARARSYSRRGFSRRAIRAKLTEKGISDDVTNEAIKIQEEEDCNLELNAAIVFSRKRRLGPFHKPSNKPERDKKKDIAKLARAGFEYTTVQQLMGAETLEELEEMVEINIYGK